MNFIYDFIPEELIKAIGWTLFHSIWQGAMVAVILSIALLIAGKKSAQLRYYFSIASLIIIMVLAISTFIKVYAGNENKLSIVNNILSDTNNVTAVTDNNSLNYSGGNNPDLIEILKINFSLNLPLIVTAWLLGFLIFSLRFIGGLLYVQRIKNFGIHPLNDFWTYRVKELSSFLKMKKTVQIYESIKVKVPVAMGYIKPVILLPLGILGGLPQDQVESIIIHELAHIKRFDFLLNLVQTFIETIFFFHPAVWWISNVMKNERENCCDDLTLNLCGGSLVYFKALYNLQQICSAENDLVLAAIGKRNQLFRRINRMNSNNRNTSYGTKFAAFAGMLIVVALVSLYTTSSAKVDARKNFSHASFVNPLVSLREKGINQQQVIASPQDTTSIKKGNRTLRFSDEVNGEEKKFKVKLNNGKIEELFIDGDKVADKDIAQYENLVSKRVDEYDAAITELNGGIKKFKAEMKQFKEKMKKFKGSYSYDYDFDFEIPPIPPVVLDSAINKKIMKELHENLNRNFTKHSFNIPPIHIPKIDIPPINIPHLDLDSLTRHSHAFDNEAFKESMKEWGKNFKKEMEKWKSENKDFKKDMEKFKEEMKKNGPNSEAFKKSMESLKVNMNKLKTEMKTLKEYLNDVKSELVKDNLMEEDDNLDGFYLSKTEMKVNGKKVSSELHKKYLELYKKHYGKDLKDDQKINFND